MLKTILINIRDKNLAQGYKNIKIEDWDKKESI